MDLVLVTSNRGKLEEIRAVFAPYGIRIRWARRNLPEPQADSLEVVVQAKLAAAGRIRRAILVEDSGLFLNGLEGFPGVYSQYVYGTIGLRGLLTLLKGKDRTAVFRAVAGVRRGRTTETTVGEAHGSIALAPRGRNGFGFDPIFVPDGQNSTFAELSPEEKNRLSHRGRAMRAMARRLVRGRQ